MDGIRFIVRVAVGSTLCCQLARTALAGLPHIQTLAADKKDDPIVPKTARLYADGRGDLSFKATRDGYVYVVDHHDEKIMFEGPIDNGETILVAPTRNVIEIDGHRVKRFKDISNKHVHHIYFERDSDVGRSKKEHDRLRKDR